jgi:hypothetical protein
MIAVRITRTARKHRIGNAHILAAMEKAGVPVASGDTLVYIGVDDRNIELEVVAVPDNRHPGGIAVIHAMPTEWRKK